MEVFKEWENAEEHSGSCEYEKAHWVEKEEKLGASKYHHEDYYEVGVIHVAEGSIEENYEDLFWDEFEAFYSFINIKTPSPELEEYEK